MVFSASIEPPSLYRLILKPALPSLPNNSASDTPNFSSVDPFVSNALTASLYVFFVSVGGVYFVVASFFFRSVSTVLSHDNTTLIDEIPSAVGNLTSPVTVKTPSVYDFVVNLKPASLPSG